CVDFAAPLERRSCLFSSRHFYRIFICNDWGRLDSFSEHHFPHGCTVVTSAVQNGTWPASSEITSGVQFLPSVVARVRSSWGSVVAFFKDLFVSLDQQVAGEGPTFLQRHSGRHFQAAIAVCIGVSFV
ncbi:unnamed protein product, partial [Ixodes pacificus]